MVLTQYTNIHLISQGIDLWGDQLPDCLVQYKEYYVRELSSLPTTTHLVERMVKLSNHCSSQNRSEITRSHYALANVGTIKKSNDIAHNIYQPTSRKKKEVEKYDVIRNKVRGNALIALVLQENATAV